MSIEAKMESLSLGDDAAIIAAIKAEGVEKSGFASSIDILKAKCASDTEADALAGLATVKALAEGCPEAEAFNKECLTACKFKCPIFTPGRIGGQQRPVLEGPSILRFPALSIRKNYAANPQ